ncbi:MAG TPA: hypothetical protein VMV84_03555 [Dehalococcoidales bacterium]|nr:hypothetical protein [Dehalococcoidales bacterium]
MGTEVKLVFHTKEVLKAIEDTASQRMAEAVNVVRNQALETLSGSRSGRTYQVPGTRRYYTASAPGEPPAQATSQLRQSIKTSVEGEGRTVIGMVGTNKIQGKMTEFGTRNMAPRPWLRISFEKALSKVKSILSRKWLQ